MDIRNLMEDKVLQCVKEICDEEEHSGRNRFNTSEQCRLDVACFVLNRVPQRYVTSGRGFAYLESDLNENLQLQVDLVTLVNEGLQRVSEVSRAFYGQVEDSSVKPPVDTHAFYYFPTIKGRIFNGLSFEPVIDVEIVMKMNDKVVRMVDGRWPNPYSIVGNTPGTYLFWPQEIPAPVAGLTEIFDFTFEIDDVRFETFQHFFSIPLACEPPHIQKTLIQDYCISDIFLIPRDKAEDGMQINPSDSDNP